MWYSPLFATLRPGLARSTPAGRSRKTKTRCRDRLRQGTFRPLLEALEDRCCLSCTVSVEDGHILQVVGDRADNRIDITDNGPDGVSVACDGGEARTYAGIDQVVLDTRGGNDVVNCLYADGHSRPADLSINLGDGADRLFVDGHARTAPGSWHIDVTSGQDQDEVQAIFGDIVDAEMSFNADLGQGNDTCAITHAGGIGGNGRFLVNVAAGSGDDVVRFDAPPHAEHPLPPPGPRARFEGAFDLGAGLDINSFIWNSVGVPHNVEVRGGPGADQIHDEWGHIQAPLTLEVQSGEDDDEVTGSFSDVFAPLSYLVDTAGGDDSAAVTLDGDMSAPIDMVVNLGSGDDRAFCDGHVRGTSPIPPTWKTEVTAGAGNDAVLLVTEVQNLNVDFRAGLGAGNDFFSAGVIPPVPSEFQPIGQRRNIDVSGGDGRDTFTTLIGALGDGEACTSHGVLQTETHFRYQGDGDDDFIRTDLANVDINAPLFIDHDGGLGHDDISIIIHFNPQPDPPAGPSPVPPVTTNPGTGGGNDGPVTEPDPAALPSVILNAPVTINLQGAQGNDDIRVISGFNPQPDPPADPVLLVNNLMQVRVDAGSGADEVGIIIGGMNVGPDGAVAVDVDTGAGDDAVRLDMHNLQVGLGGQAALAFNLGAGDDRMGWANDGVTVQGLLSVGILAQAGDDGVQAELHPFIAAGGRYVVGIDGGQGNDILRGIWDPNLMPGGSFAAEVLGSSGDDTLIGLLYWGLGQGGSFTALFDGGEGRDFLFGLMGDGTVKPGGFVDVSFLGGRGDDFIDVNVDLSAQPPDPGRLHVVVDGGEGSDLLSLLVFGSDGDEDNAFFDLDGGRGEDFALVSALVHAQNCEHVEIG